MAETNLIKITPRELNVSKVVFFVLFLTVMWLPKNSAATDGESFSNAEPQINSISGLWYTSDKDGVVELYPCEGKICGRFHWVEDEADGSISRDTKNPDFSKRSRPLCGMQFMWGFTPEGNGIFESGWIYSPRHGSNFSANLHLVDNENLILRGYFIIPLLGEDQNWTRAHDAPSCENSLPHE